MFRQINSHLSEILRRTSSVESNIAEEEGTPSLPLNTLEAVEEFTEWLKLGNNTKTTVRDCTNTIILQYTRFIGKRDTLVIN